MLYTSFNDIAFYGCKEARIRPGNENEFWGKVVVGDEEYVLRIGDNRDAGCEPRVRARVHLLKKVERERIDDYACGLASMIEDDPAFANVCVDLRDGETAFAKTWTMDYPGDKEMDEFLAQAKSFIEKHIGEVHDLAAASHAEIDEFDIFDLI